MAPVKQKTDQDRFEAIDTLLEFRSSPSLTTDKPTLEAISFVKGLFARIWKQDQWDWFTVFDRMGRPGRKQSIAMSDSLKGLRSYLVNKEDEPRSDGELEDILVRLDRLGLERCLKNYTGEWQPRGRNGQIYILSTRQQRDVLKIGYTERSIWDRVKEINSATGVFVPYGVRAVWAVENAKVTERQIHELFVGERIRSDREFFRIDYKEAFKRINNLIAEQKITEY